MHATHKAISRQRHAISAKAGSVDAHAFFNLLTGPEVFDAVELALPARRERLFPPTEALSMFLHKRSAHIAPANRPSMKGRSSP